jgi:hypothetical protein
MDISQKIQSIIDIRKTRLPMIAKQREHINNVLCELDKLDVLISVIYKEMENKSGDYYSIIAEDPKMEVAFRKIDTRETRRKANEQLRKLDLLEKRFGRDTVCIAMIGYERQGKSTFLQAISGLENDVIPAYSGTSCTGAVSVIHNIDGPFRAEIEMYSKHEFMEIVRDKLLKFFPDRTFNINTPEDLPNLDLSGFVATGPNAVLLTTEFNKFKEAYCNHVEVYSSLLGLGKLTITDESKVIEHVAQYQEFAEQPIGDDWYTEEKNDHKMVYKRNYYKYIAVKNVNIFKRFNLIDCRQIQLVDTIGMGDANNAAAIEKEMFRVLREDCDAAVNIFKPDSLGGGFNQTQADILQKISTQLEKREPSKWIVYILNKVIEGPGVNVANISKIIRTVENVLDNLQNKPVAWIKAVQGNSVEEVRDLLVKPLLDLISANLADLDKTLMDDANKCGQELYAEYFKLATSVEAVLSNSVIKGSADWQIFNQLYQSQEQILFRKLRELDEDNYGRQRTKPCPEIGFCLKDTIENLYQYVPDLEIIKNEVCIGGKSMDEIFAMACDDLSNKIYKAFELVSTNVILPLREKLKKDLATCMLEEGVFGRIPLKDYDPATNDSLLQLRCLLAERIPSDTYPNLYEALNYILDFHFNIEDTIEDDVAQSIGIIDKMNIEEFKALHPAHGGLSVDERAQFIWQELCNRISPMQVKLREYSNRFALIPSRRFATRVQKFRVKIVFNVDTKNELRDFYHANCYAIWHEEFSKAEAKQQAFGQWNAVSEAISALNQRQKFELTI